MARFNPSRRGGFSLWCLALVLNAILLAFAVFFVTQAVKQREANVNRLNRNIVAEQQTIRVLDAEWAYLTRPQRLEELVDLRAGIAPGPVAKIEPASGTTAAPKPEEDKPVAAKAEPVEKPAPKAVQAAPVKKVAVKPVEKLAVQKAETRKTPAPKAAEAEIIWSPKKNRAAPAPTRMAETPTKHVGVARPILE